MFLSFFLFHTILLSLLLLLICIVKLFLNYNYWSIIFSSLLYCTNINYLNLFILKNRSTSYFTSQSIIINIIIMNVISIYWIVIDSSITFFFSFILWKSIIVLNLFNFFLLIKSLELLILFVSFLRYCPNFCFSLFFFLDDVCEMP